MSLDKMEGFEVFVIIGIIFACVMLVVIYLKVRDLALGDCAGVPTFDSSAKYTKSMTIPLINKTISGVATFQSNNNFTLDFGSDGVYTGNIWTYDKNNCQLSVSLNADLQNTITKYGCSINTDVKIDRSGNLVVSGNILSVLPISVVLTKS